MTIENRLKIYKAFICVLSVFFLVIVFFIIFDNKTSQNAKKGGYNEIVDTIVVEKIIEVPKEKIKYKEIKIIDTVYLTTEPLTIEQKYYTDSVADIYISGIKPEIDSINYHIPTIYVDRTIEVEKPKKWYEDRFIFSAGIYTGYSPIYKNFDVIVGFGVGIRLGK